jgi:hypothetical protein
MTQIKIIKKRTGILGKIRYHVTYSGNNGEVLSSCKNLKTFENAEKNIRAMSELFFSLIPLGDEIPVRYNDMIAKKKSTVKVNLKKPNLLYDANF